MDSIRTLAHAAKLRQIPMLFEQQWEARTGKNPVALAIEYDARAQARIVAIMVSIAAFAVSALTLAAIVQAMSALGPKADPLAYAPFFHGIFLQGIFLAVSFAVGITSTLLTPLPTDQILAFRTDLDAFLGWSNINLKINRLATYSDEALRQSARGIMVDATRSILEVENWPVQGVEAERELGTLRIQRATKYDTLVRLGLVSGGFDSFHKEAVRLMKKAEKDNTAA